MDDSSKIHSIQVFRETLEMSRMSQIEVQAARAFSLKDYARALGHLRDLLEMVGDNPHTLHMMAVCHARRNDHAQALACATRALDAAPAHLESLKLLAEIHCLRGDQEKARVFVGRALGSASAPRRAPSRRPWHWFLRYLGALLPGRAGRDPRDLSAGDHEQWLAWAHAFMAESVSRDDSSS